VDFPKPIATDNCDMNPNTNGVRDDGLLLHQPFGLGITIIHWTATDAAGNIGTCDQVIEVVDNTPPDFDPCPPDIETKPDLGECFATVDITQPVVRDNCDTNVFVQGTREDGLDLNDPYPADDCITITWVAQDNEGNLSTCYQEVCVRATNTLVVNLQVLEPIINTELTRCFTFVLHDCTGGMVTTVEAEITMIDGQARSAEIEIPCGTWECVTAKDTLHTVRRTSDLTSVANQYHADFTGGNALVPGDLNNDGEVNVLDSGILTGLLTFNYGTGDTSCPIPTTAEYVANPGIAIPDDNNVGISHTINVPDFFFVDDLDIDLVINHTHVGDLCVSITHNGTTVDIIQEIGNANAGCNHAFFGCSSNNLNVVLDDEGTGGALDSLPCPGNTNPFPTSPPNYTPLNPLSAFDGMDASGDWTINVSDTEAADLGTLVTWSLHFDLTPPPPFHADFDGDGIVWMPDCSVIGAYFRAENAPDCCNPRLAGPAAPPLERISVAELLERGLPMVAAGDFNRDGWVDLDDLADAMAAYAATAAPSNPVLEPSGSFAAADGSWFTAANWATGAMPDASSDLSIDARVRVDGAGAQARSLTISQRGGVIISGSLTASSMTVQAGGTLALEAGGILRIGVLNLEPGAILEWSSGVIEVSGGVFHHASLDLVIGSGALRLLNGATAIVTAGAFIGADPAHGGELLVNDSTFIAGNDLVVGFTGDGLLRVIRGGAVHAGALTLTSAATLAGDLTGEIDITGHAQIGGTLTVRLPAGFAEPAIGRRFTLLSAASIDGRFEEVSLPVLPAGLYFELAYGERAIELVVQDSAPGVTPEAEPVPADPAIGAE
jgi:T5SS/PEP-CTERM-associated repeat protein